MESYPIFCQSCGREAPTMYVDYRQNIGVLVMRFSKHVHGNFCKDCSNKYFWSYIGTTLFLGWWGIISFFVTLSVLPNNITYYFLTRRMESPNTATAYPTLTDAAIERLRPFTAELLQRVNAGEKMEAIARSIAPRAGGRPGHVILFTLAVSKALNKKT